MTVGLAPVRAATEVGPEVRMPKPTARIAYGEDGGEADVWVRPSPGTVLKCIAPYGNRALLHADGVLTAWSQADLYHGDVLDHPELHRSGDAVYLTLHPPGSHEVCVSVKGDAEDPVPYEDEAWLAVLRGNRTLRALYGPDFPVDSYNWF